MKYRNGSLSKGTLDISGRWLTSRPTYFRCGSSNGFPVPMILGVSDGDAEFTQFPENHRFQVPEGCHWKDVWARSVNVGYLKYIAENYRGSIHGAGR